MKTIRDYLPSGPKKDTMIQGRVPEHVAELTRLIMERQQLNWSDVLTACLQKFNDEEDEE